MKQELDPADIVEEEEEEEEDDEEDDEDEEEEEEECRKFSPKHCQKLQFSIAQIMGFDSSETTENAGQGEEDTGLQDDHRDQSDQGHHGDQSDQMGRGRWSEEGERLAKEVKVGRLSHNNMQYQIISLLLPLIFSFCLSLTFSFGLCYVCLKFKMER